MHVDALRDITSRLHALLDLIGNMTALIVKGSRTERFRDKMTELIRYMNRNRLGSDIRSQVKAHLLLQYESSYKRDRIVDDIPAAVRSKVLFRASGYFFFSVQRMLRRLPEPDCKNLSRFMLVSFRFISARQFI